MKTLGKRKFEMSREAEPCKGKDGLLRMEPNAGFFDTTYALIAPTMLKLMGIMANSVSLEDVRALRGAFQAAMPVQMELNEISDPDLLKICAQLRDLWGELTGDGWKNPSKNVRGILQEWWKKYPLDDNERWLISYETGTFFPRETNFRALMARILFDNRQRLQICVNCGKHFLKRRHDSRYCMEINCRRVDNNERQRKFAEKAKGAK